MWVTFFLVMAAAASFLYVPGFFILRALRLEPIAALCCAPLPTILFYVALSAVYPTFGISASWVSLFLPSLAVAVVACAVSFKVAPDFGSDDFVDESCGTFFKGRLSVDWAILIVAIAVNLLIAGWVFVVSLDGPGSFSQAWDNVHHLGSVKAFLDSGVYSSFTTSSYAAVVDAAENPFVNDSAFYPSAWHCLVAMSASATGAPVFVAVNAVNAVIAGIVFPVSFFVFIRALFPAKRGVLWCGSFMPLLFTAFPWGFLIWGPLYPNLLSYSLIFACMFVFLRLFKKGIARFYRVEFVLLALVGMATLAFAQPNALFTLGVLVAAFLVVSISGIVDRFKCFSKGRTAWKLLIGALAVLAIFIIWSFVYKTPFVAGVVAFDWPAKTTLLGAVSSALLLSCVELPAQPVLAFVVLIGFFAFLANARYRWVAFSYAFAFVIYAIDMGVDGPLKHFLAGFWYTDQWRTAAMLALAAAPLAAYGSFALARGVASLLERIPVFSGNRAKLDSIVMGLAPFAIAIVVLMVPYVASDGGFRSAFDALKERMASQNCATAQDVFEKDEREFVEQAVELVGKDELIINDPGDGSVFAYPFDGANTYYRYLSGFSGDDDETRESYLIRTGIDRISYDPEVRDAVAEVGAEYMLMLDSGWVSTMEESTVYRHFWPHQGVGLKDWKGVTAVTDETPGFEIVLSEGDMRLYRIVA